MSSLDLGRLLPAIVCVIAFLMGSIPFGLLVARIFKVKDLTSQGSGNIGATNVSRVLGFWPAGALTFALDLLKGILPVLALLPMGSQIWLGTFGLPETDFSATAIWSAGLFAVLGHCYSPWLHFKGGKGVATGFGVLVVLSPLAGLAGILAFLVGGVVLVQALIDQCRRLQHHRSVAVEITPRSVPSNEARHVCRHPPLVPAVPVA